MSGRAEHSHSRLDGGPEPTGADHDRMYPACPVREERIGFAPIYEYVLREWWEDWDTVEASRSANGILDSIEAAGLVVKVQLPLGDSGND